jgi:Na+/proline symporter
MLGVGYAMYLIESVLYTFLLTETLATFVGIGVVGGIIWPRANRWGALASLVCALATNFALYWITGQRLDHWDANVFLAALVAGIAALVIVSLLTAPEPSGKLDSFFTRLRTSSDDEREDPLLLVNLLRPGQAGGWRAFREDLGGFTLGWILVFVLVGLTALFLAS